MLNTGFIFAVEKLKPNFITNGSITKMQNATPDIKSKLDIKTTDFIKFLSLS